MRCSLLLAAALMTGLNAFAQVDHGLLDLVPGGTRFLAGIRVEEGKVSPLGQSLLQSAARNEPQFQKLLDATGFDPRRDLQEVLFASSGNSTGNGHREGVLLARGTFDPEHIKTTVVAKGGSVEPYQGFNILSGSRGDAKGVVFLDETLAVLGRRADLKAMIANRNSPATIDPELQKRMEAASTGNEAWFVSIVPGSEFAAHANVGPKGQEINGAVLQSIVQSSGTVHCAAKSVDVKFDATTRSEKDAQSLSDVIRFMASMVQMQRQNQKSAGLLASALDGMQLSTTGNSTHFALSVPEATVEQMVILAGIQHAE